MILVEVF